MKNTFRNLIFLSVLLFSASYDSCISGVAYDNKYKLAPEFDDYSCVLGAKVYGQRWQKLGTLTLFIGTVSTFTAFIVRRRKQEKDCLRQNLSILLKEE